MKNKKNKKTTYPEFVWTQEKRFKRFIYELTGKNNLTKLEIWASYLNNPDKDMFGEWLSDVVDNLINSIDHQVQDTDYLLCVFFTSIEFYLLTEKIKYIIESAKINPIKKTSYFIFEPSGNPLRNANKGIFGGNYLFGNTPYLPVYEQNVEPFENIINRSLKYNTLVPQNRLKKLRLTEKKLYSFLHNLILLIGEKDIFKIDGYEKFPVQKKAAMFLIQYCKSLFKALASAGKKTECIQGLEKHFRDSLMQGRLLWVYKIYNKKKFFDDFNTLILNEYYLVITDALKSEPIDVPIPDEDRYQIRLCSLKGKKISEITKLYKPNETTLSKVEILECLFAQKILLRDKKSEVLWGFTSRFFNYQHPLLREYDVFNMSSDNLVDMIEILLNSFEKKITDNLGILLMIYNEIKNLSWGDFNQIFKIKTDEEKSDIELYFKLSDEKTSKEQKTPQEWLLKKYLNADDRKPEKITILHSFLYFLLWNQTRHMVPLSQELNPKDSNCNGYHRINARQKLINEFYNNAILGKYADLKVIADLYNKIFQSVLWTVNEKFNLSEELLGKLDNNTLCHLVYNFSQSHECSTQALYTEMTFISDMKKRFLPTIFNKNKKFNTESEAKAYLNEIITNRRILKEIDCGMNFGLCSKPVKSADAWWARSMNLKFFTDTDKKYFESSTKPIRNGKKYIIKAGDEDFRTTNKNHLENYYFYETLRNPSVHNSDVLVIHSLCDDNKIEYLMKAIYDCNEFAKVYLKNLDAENAKGGIWIPTLFYMQRLKELAELLEEKMENLPYDKRNFETWFDENGNITLDPEYYINVSYSDDFVFLDKVKSLFTKFYCLDDDLLSCSDFEFDFGINLILYVIYLNVKLFDVITSQES